MLQSGISFRVELLKALRLKEITSSLAWFFLPPPYSATDLEYEILYNPGFIPVRRGMVSVKTVTDSTGRRYLMRNHAGGSYYHLDEHSHTIWTLIDGSRKVPQILEGAGKKKVGTQEAYEILLFFAEAGALSSKSEEKKRGRLRVVSPFRVEVPVIHRSEEFLQGIHRAIGPLLRRSLLWLTLGFILITSVLFVGSFTAIFGDPRNFQIAGSTIIGLFFYNFIILTPVIAIHEISHGLALVHYGGKPGEMGFGLLYFGLMFYTDATDSWSLVRNQRIMVLLAGILSTGLIGATLVTILYLGIVPSQSFAHQLILMTAFWCFYSALWNLAPAFETDGYFTLADFLNMPELKSDAYRYFRRVLRNLFRRPGEKVVGDNRRKNTFLLGYLIASTIFLAYIIYATLRIAFYMAQDASSAFARLIFTSNLAPIQTVVAILSVFYFILNVSGYGVVFAIATKKAATRTLKFESVHDHKISVLAILPEKVPGSLARELNGKMRALGKNYASSLKSGQAGPLHFVVLRMGSAMLAVQQIRAHLRKTEIAFNKMYQKIVMKHRASIDSSVGIYSPRKERLTRLLVKMGRELSYESGGEAMRISRQTISEQQRRTIYLLNAAFSTVWTLELPPAQQQEFEEALMPSALAEDLSVTDLFGEVEEFKKRTIYGYDSLRALGIEQRANLERTIANPETYHLVFSFEPVKGRLLFVGRTEQIEEVLPEFAAVLLGQVWSGYMDDLLNETNLSLSVLIENQTPTDNAIQSLQDGELTTLRKNVKELAASREYVSEVTKELRHQLQATTTNLKKISTRMAEIGTPGLNLLESVFSMNRENMESLPDRLKDLDILTKNLHGNLSELSEVLEPEYAKREVAYAKRKRGIRNIYPVFLALTAVAGVFAYVNGSGSPNFLLLGVSLLLQALYGSIYLLHRRNFYRIGRYSSPDFNKIEMPLFALNQSLFKFVSTADILRPGDLNLKELHKAESKGNQGHVK